MGTPVSLETSSVTVSNRSPITSTGQVPSTMIASGLFLLDNQTEKMTKGPLCLTRRDLVFREPGAVHVLSTGARVVVETIQAVLFTVNNQRKNSRACESMPNSFSTACNRADPIVPVDVVPVFPKRVRR